MYLASGDSIKQDSNYAHGKSTQSIWLMSVDLTCDLSVVWGIAVPKLCRAYADLGKQAAERQVKSSHVD